MAHCPITLIGIKMGLIKSQELQEKEQAAFKAVGGIISMLDRLNMIDIIGTQKRIHRFVFRFFNCPEKDEHLKSGGYFLRGINND